LRASPPPKPTPKRTSKTPAPSSKATSNPSLPAIFAGYLIRIHRKEDLLDAEYLTYFLNSQIAFDYGKTVVISSVNQANINGTKLKSYPIPAPSLAEQKAIVAKLNELSEETNASPPSTNANSPHWTI
jgi:type I restriction enzyme S subunit